jgi:hypothetical protein
MDQDPRAKELDSLRLALATFALRLDAFEARLKDQARKAKVDSATSKARDHTNAG